MQIKPNLLDTQMNVSSAKTKYYENKPRLRTPGKQTQSNPISKGIPYCSAVGFATAGTFSAVLFIPAILAIMAYSAKYASAFYGPFRDVADSAPVFGDRKSYQMDPANSNQAMQEIEQDIAEGADIVMAKPALCFLDIIARAKERFDCPIAAYNVSGEYMMLNTTAQAGPLDKEVAMMEVLCSIKRVGADIIIIYFAKKVAKLLS